MKEKKPFSGLIRIDATGAASLELARDQHGIAAGTRLDILLAPGEPDGDLAVFANRPATVHGRGDAPFLMIDTLADIAFAPVRTCGTKPPRP